MTHTLTIASSAHESPHFFQAGDETLFGVLATPSVQPVGVGVVLLSGAHFPSTNRNRLSVQLARRLAGRGYHAFRFDYHGVGESTGVVQEYRLDRPFSEDLMAAIELISSQGASRIVLVGSCLGARTALACAPAVRALAGLILVSVPLRDFSKGGRGAATLASEWGLWQYAKRGLRPSTWRRIGDPVKRAEYATLVKAKAKSLRAVGTREGGAGPGWVSPSFLDPLSSLAERGTPTLFVFGEEDANHADFKAARSGQLGRLLERSDHFKIATVPGEIAGFSDIGIQRQVAELVTTQIGRWT